jgi:hypothetical protein
MRTLLPTAILAYVWYAYAEPFSLFLYHHAARENALTLYRDDPAIFAGLLFAGLIVVSMMLKAISHRHRGDGLWSSGPARRTIGFVAGTLLWVSIAFALIAVLAWLLPDRATPPALAFFCARFLRRPCKIFLGRATRPLRWLLAGRHFGMGGTSKFSGLMDEWANPWRPGRVLLGASLYDPKWLVGVEDDRHACLIATSRAGKARSVLYPIC